MNINPDSTLGLNLPISEADRSSVANKNKKIVEINQSDLQRLIALAERRPDAEEGISVLDASVTIYSENEFDNGEFSEGISAASSRL
jgi:hypothetical protein